MDRKRLFGTDGVRGEANVSLTVDTALKLGVAAGCWIQHCTASSPESQTATAPSPAKLARQTVVIGRDTRISCDMLESALTAGLTSMGIDVVCLGIAPTPAVSYAVTLTGASAGIVISASHNPFEDNGIKFFGPDGRKLPDSVEDEIQQTMENPGSLRRPKGVDLGTLTRATDAIDAYVDHVISTLPANEDGTAPLHGLSLVLDCANGASYRVAPCIFERLGADVTVIHVSPTGVNINLDCGSTHPKSMAALVKQIGADAGLAFDGDADRVMLADENGTIVDGDRMMAIIAGSLNEKGRLTHGIVVATIMSNVGLEQALQAQGMQLHRTNVGDRYVSEAMVELGAAIGGEQSGHILLPYVSVTGDGIVTGLQVLQVLRDTGKTLSELASVVKSCPQRLTSIRVKDRTSWERDADIQAAIVSGGARLGNEKWLSVRPSGTEPLIRVMAQGPDAAVVDEVVTEICGLVRARYGVAAS